MKIKIVMLRVLILSIFFIGSVPGTQKSARDLEVRKTVSADGVKIVYTVGGGGEPVLVFIHGGFADRTFWKNQLAHFSGKYRYSE